MRTEAESTPCILGRVHKSCRPGSRAATESTRRPRGGHGLIGAVESHGRAPRRCASATDLVVERTIPDRSGYYIGGNHLNSQTDLVAAGIRHPCRTQVRNSRMSATSWWCHWIIRSRLAHEHHVIAQ